MGCRNRFKKKKKNLPALFHTLLRLVYLAPRLVCAWHSAGQHLPPHPVTENGLFMSIRMNPYHLASRIRIRIKLVQRIQITASQSFGPGSAGSVLFRKPYLPLPVKGHMDIYIYI